jgi:hypothetical protein
MQKQNGKYTRYDKELGSYDDCVFDTYNEALQFYADCEIDKARDQDEEETVRELEQLSNEEILEMHDFEIQLIV